MHSTPNANVIYDTVYSDNTDELTNHYDTGSGSGKAGATGVYHDSWKLASNVPSGVATVNVGATYGSQLYQTKTTFKIVPVGQTCPA